MKKRKKGTYRIADFAVPADHLVKLKEGEKKDKCPNLSRELMKLWNMKVTVIPIVIGTIFKRLVKGHERLRNKRASRDHLDLRITKIGKNTGKSPGDLRRLAVTQTPVKNHRLTLMWKTFKGVKYQ